MIKSKISKKSNMREITILANSVMEIPPVVAYTTGRRREDK